MPMAANWSGGCRSSPSSTTPATSSASSPVRSSGSRTISPIPRRRLLGQHLPENFDRPFTARNFLEFWQRWHMTLSNWFKLYLFNPLVGALAGRFPSRAAAPYLGVIAFFVTFGVMGVWHGTTTVFVIYGLLMGAGASANKLWQVALARRLGKQGYRRLAENPLYLYGCRGVTY